MKKRFVSILSAFTLVELLVVITLLAILTTIASLYLFENFANSRDSARRGNLDQITKNLELYFIDNGVYPQPDNAVDIIYSGSTLWTQGTFGTGVLLNLENFGLERPVDPKFENEFAYSVTNMSHEYQIGTIFEGVAPDEVSLEAGIPQASAEIERAYVVGDYNYLMARTKIGDDYHYIATPSIIASDLSQTGALDIILGKKLVYHDFFNLPATYSGFLAVDGGFNFNVSDPVIFSGSLSELRTQAGINVFIQKLQYIYATTPTESFDIYISLLDEEGISRTKKFLTKQYNISFNIPFSCQDIFDLGEGIEDGFYDIDPDGSGPLGVDTVYCDMVDGGEAWTRIDGNHLGSPDGSFSTGNDISTYYPVSANNSIITMTNPTSSSYVLHQNGGGANTRYEIHFDDYSVAQVGDEIRMSLWVTDEGDGGWTDSLGFNPSAGYMFHNRIFYTDGTFSSNGAVTVLDTQVAGGKTWKHLQVKNQVTKTPQDFSWYIALDAEDTRDLYITGVELELYRR